MTGDDGVPKDGHGRRRGPAGPAENLGFLNPQVVDRVLAGEASADDRAQVRAWLAMGAEDLEVVPALRRALGAADPLADAPWDEDAAWARVDARMKATHATSAPTASAHEIGTAPPRRRVAAILLRAAAVLVVVGGAGTMWWTGQRVEPTLQYATANAERDSVSLPDGSMVVLSAGSALEVLAGFGSPVREVSLEGGAFFEVVSDSTRPFTVHAGGTTTRVLGTAFLVASYPGSNRVEVAVADGLVSVKGPEVADSVLLGPGLAVHVESGTLERPRPSDVSARLAWTAGPLVLVDATLEEVLPEVTRWLDVEFAPLDPELAGRRVSLRLRRGDREAVEGLALAIGALIEREGSVVRLVPMTP